MHWKGRVLDTRIETFLLLRSLCLLILRRLVYKCEYFGRVPSLIGFQFYLQARLYRPLVSRLVLPVMQFSLFGGATFVSLTRISDYKHHW